MSIISLALQNKPFCSILYYISTTKILKLCSARNFSPSIRKKSPFKTSLSSQSKHGDVCTPLCIISEGSEISQISIFKGLSYFEM